MRYLLGLCLLVVTVPVLGYNEVVSAISYNPSRLGAYTHLKVAEKATLKGGLRADTIDVLRNVQIRDLSCTQDVAECRLNRIGTVELFGNADTVRTSATGGILQGSTGTSITRDTSYNGGAASTNSGLKVVMSGGTLKASTNNTSKASYIGTITGTPNLEIETENLTAQGTSITVTDQIRVGGMTIEKPSSPEIKGKRYGFEDRIDSQGTLYSVFSLLPQ